MKKPHIVLVLLITFFIVASCKKDEVDLPHSELSLSADYNGVWTLNLYQNKLDIRGNIAPKDTPNNQLLVKITSDADTIGFEIMANLSNKELDDNKRTYKYKDLSESVSAASFTDKNRRLIKVNPNGDNIKVQLESNLLNGNFPVNCQDVLHLTYWPYDNSATLFLKGYNYTGKEDQHVYIWTSRDPSPIIVQLQYDNPMQYAAQPHFSSYNTNLMFINSYSAYPNLLGVFFQNDVIFIDYNGIVYRSVLGINTFAPLLRTY